MKVDGVPERRVDCNGIEIAYWIHGDGAPILLITGWGTPAASWGPFPSVLAQMGYKGIVIENRDIGRSSPCDDVEYTVADMASDAALVLTDAGIDSAYVLGISMGGMIAQELALNHPDRVERLMLLATSPGVGSPESVAATPEFLSSLVYTPADGDLKTWTQRMVGSLVGRKTREEHADRLTSYSSVRVDQQTSAASFGRQLTAMHSLDTWNRLPELKIPTIVLHGTDDQLIPFENGEKLASRIPGAEFVALEGVGHLIPLETPEETLSAIARFFPVEAEVTT